VHLRGPVGNPNWFKGQPPANPFGRASGATTETGAATSTLNARSIRAPLIRWINRRSATVAAG